MPSMNMPLPDTATGQLRRNYTAQEIRYVNILMAIMNPCAAEIIAAAWINFMIILSKNCQQE